MDINIHCRTFICVRFMMTTVYCTDRANIIINQWNQTIWQYGLRYKRRDYQLSRKKWRDTNQYAAIGGPSKWTSWWPRYGTNSRRTRDYSRYLLQTGDKILIEDSPYDNFWGVGSDGKGRNQLGRCLMDICECIWNLIKGRVPLKSKQLKALRRYKRLLRKTALKKTSRNERRRILQTGGFISAVLPALISGLASLAPTLLGFQGNAAR